MGRMKGAGYVYFDKKRGKWFWQEKINGKRITRKLDAKNEAEANTEAARYAHIAKVKSEEEIAVFAARSRRAIKEAQPGIALNEALKQFEASPRRQEVGKQRENQYKSIYRDFSAFLVAEYPALSTLDEVTQSIAEEYAAQLKKAKGARTYNVYIGSLKTIFTTLLPGEPCPFRDIKKQKESPVSNESLTAEQVNAVFAAVDGEMKLTLMHRAEMAVLFRLGAFTGLRLEDCCIIKWAAVNLDQKMITWVPAKTKHSSGRPVHIPVHPDLEKQLKIASKWKDKSGYILPKIAERYAYNPVGIRKDAQKVIHWSLWQDKKEGLRPDKPSAKYGFHSFRHSFVSRCANAGVPMPVVQAIVGHSSALVTRIYTHLADSTVKQIIKALS